MKVTFIGSPNYDSKRKAIDRIVIHWFGAGKLKGVDAHFQKPNGTSAHYAIEDSTVHQYVMEDKVAYHAGNYAMNQRSIGIEHSAEPNRPASEETYTTSGKLVAEIAKRYNIPLDRKHIIKHSEVKATQCPGTMDIDKIINLAKGSQNGGNQSDMTEQQKKDLESMQNLRKYNGVWYESQDIIRDYEKMKQERDDARGKLSKANVEHESALKEVHTAHRADLAKMEADCQQKIEKNDIENEKEVEKLKIDHKAEVDKLKDQLKKKVKVEIIEVKPRHPRLLWIHNILMGIDEGLRKTTK